RNQGQLRGVVGTPRVCADVRRHGSQCEHHGLPCDRSTPGAAGAQCAEPAAPDVDGVAGCARWRFWTVIPAEPTEAHVQRRAALARSERYAGIRHRVDGVDGSAAYPAQEGTLGSRGLVPEPAVGLCGNHVGLSSDDVEGMSMSIIERVADIL